ncbi:MAG: S-layer homology domain-containing protein [Oscillibacter sp.]|jgi:hypothetical protein|nr:S-layer homology domain-containing protein [Oscillibacter sp.]
MKKRWLALLTCAVLTVSLCAPAYAEDLNDELARVTLAVKKTLSIGSDYSDFSGNVRDGGALRRWTLQWSDKAGDGIEVTADDSGRVMEYSAEQHAQESPSSGGYDPAFSKVTPAAAAQTAKAFLKAVLAPEESFTLEEGSGVMPLSAAGGDYWFNAEILRSGLPVPDGARIEVGADTGKVISFWREDVSRAYVNDLPSAAPAVDAARAGTAFSDAVKLELQYVAGDGDTTAVLRYVPVSTPAASNFYVDAQTGVLTDLSKAWGNLSSSGTGSASSAAADSNMEASKQDAALSEAEQAAVQRLKGVLPKETLDAAARKVTALGLDRYQLSSAAYQADEDSDEVTCVLQYSRTLGAGEIDASRAGAAGNGCQLKILTVDARTGALREGWSYRPWYMKDVSADRAKLQTAADSFLKAFYSKYAPSVALSGGEDGAFTYSRKENGYFYYDNSVSIEVDPADGSINAFQSCWTEDLRFESADKLISAAAAQSAYCAAYQAKLRYIAYPVAVDTTVPLWKTYAEQFGVVAYRYVLGYTWEQEGASILGVNAKTGKLERMEEEKDAAAYTDLSGSFAKTQIDALSAAGIRFGADSRFRPGEALTEKSMLVLLLNSCGYDWDEAELDEDGLDGLYSAAWDQGFLPRGQRSPDWAVTRLGLVKAILSPSPYGDAAKVQGIFKAAFRDAGAIPAADLGYAALAQGLGMARGDARGRFQPNRTVTRQAAAVILYNYMNR